MNTVFSLILLSLFTVSCIHAQGAINRELSNLLEYFDPIWRRHRANFMPFINTQVVPVFRRQRSINETDNLVNCLYLNNKLACMRGETETLECDAAAQMPRELFQYFTTFGINIQKDAQMTTFNLMPRMPKNRNTVKKFIQAYLKENTNSALTIHSSMNKMEQGIEVKDQECWQKMSQMFTSSVEMKQVAVKKLENRQMSMQSQVMNVIGNVDIIQPDDEYLLL